MRDGQLWRRERERCVPHAWAQAKARRRSPTARALQALARALQAYSNGWTVSFHRSEKTSHFTRRPHPHRGACDGQGVPSSRRANAVSSSELRPAKASTPLKAQTYALNVWRPQRVVASNALSRALQDMPRAGCRGSCRAHGETSYSGQVDCPQQQTSFSRILLSTIAVSEA